MRREFGFDAIASTEFCVSARERQEHANYLVPSDRSVQNAMLSMLMATVEQYEAVEGGPQRFELSEKYAAREALVADLASDDMAKIRSLYSEEGWPPNPSILREPARIAYYFAVFRDRAQRKLLGIRRAAQFKGVVKRRLLRLVDDSLTMVDDHLFRLDHEFDFLVGPRHVYILHPAGFDSVGEVEEMVSARARQRALALGRQIKFADFSSIAEHVAHHKRAARLVAALASRSGLSRIKRSRFIRAAEETEVLLENFGQKIRPSSGSEMAFLELLDDRRYTTMIRTGPKEAYIASSRKPLRTVV